MLVNQSAHHTRNLNAKISDLGACFAATCQQLLALGGRSQWGLHVVRADMRSLSESATRCGHCMLMRSHSQTLPRPRPAGFLTAAPSVVVAAFRLPVVCDRNRYSTTHRMGVEDSHINRQPVTRRERAALRTGVLISSTSVPGSARGSAGSGCAKQHKIMRKHTPGCGS